VVVAKRLHRAKSRLARELGPEARRTLARDMLERVLSEAGRAGELHGLLVATDGDDVAQLATARGAVVLRDAPSRPPLSRVTDAALEAVSRLGATHALVLMADLPRVEARDVSELLSLLRGDDCLVVPDEQRTGTNALGVRLSRAVRTCFGHPDSLSRHLRALSPARARVVVSPRIAFDVDTTSDLRRLGSLGPYSSAMKSELRR
jgi:2-phospho-L-lactate guanylyltransferase